MGGAAAEKLTAAEFPALLDRELPEEPPAPNGLRLASFFCGCGGVDLGFRSAGFELAFANDHAPRAAETFARNLGHEPLVGDVRGVDARGLEGVDVLTGGFPCVTFSTAGRRMGVVDDLNGKLYLEMCRVIREARPRYFVAENVRGMLSANGGNAVKLVLASFLRLGYRVQWELVNMAAHGVPQTRQRVVFFGARLDEYRGAFRFPRRTNRVGRGDPRWLPPPVSLREAVGDLGDPVGSMHVDAWEKSERGAASGYSNFHPRGAGEPVHALTTQGMVVAARNPDFFNPERGAGEPSPMVATTPPEVRVANHECDGRGLGNVPHGMHQRFAGDSRAAPSVVATGPPPLVANHVATPSKGTTNRGCSERGGNPSEPSPTIALNGSTGVPWKEVGVRRMSVRECARVQTFPDWFEFAGSLSDCYRQVGNAVPPLYARRLAESIIEYDGRPRCE